MQEIEILLKCNDFIIIYKPCGVSVHKQESQIGLTTQLAKQLNLKQVWLVHRLDKATSGLLILALDQQTAVIFGKLFADHKIHKTYLALSSQKPKKKQGLIIGDMKKARNKGWKLCQTRENPAITRFHSYYCDENLRLFVLRPQTGKTHQLRVAMKSLGSPILGDEIYSKNTQNYMYLHAYQLEFEFKDKAFKIQCKPKQGELWQLASVQAKLTEILQAEQ